MAMAAAKATAHSGFMPTARTTAVPAAEMPPMPAAGPVGTRYWLAGLPRESGDRMAEMADRRARPDG